MNQDFRATACNGVGGWANGGQGKLALVADESIGPPMLRFACRNLSNHQADEQGLFAQIVQSIEASGYALSRTLIAEYYVSLKTNPFVVLTGSEGRAKTEFARLFAEAIVGRSYAQYALIPGGTWHNGTGEDHYYRALHTRFCSWRFLELLQDAASPENTGKAYFACFDALHPDELEYYFATLLRVTPAGEKRLNLPGFPGHEQPVVPPNLFITATVNMAEWGAGLRREALRYAGLIEFRAPVHAQPLHAPAPPVPPPVGYQRLWLQAALHDVESARARLLHILGPDQLGRLRCSPELARLLWRAGVVLRTQTLHELTTYIANSFDAQGRGLFDPHHPWRNAQLAFDAQVVQRVLWRLRAAPDAALRRDLTAYLDRMAARRWRQAVA